MKNEVEERKKSKLKLNLEYKKYMNNLVNHKLIDNFEKTQFKRLSRPNVQSSKKNDKLTSVELVNQYERIRKSKLQVRKPNQTFIEQTI